MVVQALAIQMCHLVLGRRFGAEEGQRDELMHPEAPALAPLVQEDLGIAVGANEGHQDPVGAAAAKALAAAHDAIDRDFVGGVARHCPPEGGTDRVAQHASGGRDLGR